MTERATCWSITINNPTPEDVRCEMPGWTLEGQYEEGAEGTKHFQGRLKTPQVRFSAVKNVFPRAHIEVARNPEALAKYVRKEDTRIAEFASTTTMNMFQAQDRICCMWNETEFKSYWPEKPEINWTEKDYTIREDAVLRYVDKIVSKQISQGETGLEFTGINPMWRSSWKKFYRAILERFTLKNTPACLVSQTDKDEEAEIDAIRHELNESDAFGGCE